MNEEWLHNTRSYSVFEAGGCSDHLRCRIYLKHGESKKRKPFKFTNAIAKMPEFVSLMGRTWREYEAIYQSTSAMYMLTKRLKALKQPLRELSKIKLGELPKRTREAYLELCGRQKETMKDPSPEKLRVESEAMSKWQRLAELEE